MATRIITGIILVILVVAVLFLSNTIVFNIAISLISIIIIRELFKAEKCNVYKSSYAICLTYVAVMPFLGIQNISHVRMLFAVVSILLLFITYLAQHKSLNFDKLSFMITTTALVSLAMCCIISIKNADTVHGIFYVILTIAGAWVSDAAAYFVGTFLGKHKLAPEISPKKTIEGAVGGIILTGLLFDLISFVYMKFQETSNVFFDVNYVLIACLGMACAIVGMIGDLSASLLKRQCQIKDYGNLMPGHGGMLDRFDSVLFVAPFMSIILSYVKIFN